MFNLREDFGELYSQVNELYPEETKQRISEVISTLIDEGYSDAAITCFFETQDSLSIEEKYMSISESYEIPEQNIDRVSSLYQEGWAGRLAKNLLKHGKSFSKGARNFVTGGKKVAGKVGDDAVHGVQKTLKGNNITGSNWKSGANPAGKPQAPKVDDSLGKQIKDTATAAKKGIKNNKWGTAAAGTIGAGIGLGAITSGEDANKKAMEKLKKDKAELDKQLKGDTTDTPPKTETPKLKDPGAYTPKVEKPKDQSKVEKPKTVAPEKKKANVPDGIARGITGAMDAMTGNMTDFDQRGGKPVGLARIVTGIADKLTGDRFDFDKRGASKLNKGQRDERDKNYVKKSETPKQTTPDTKPETKKDTGLSFADAIKLANQLQKNKTDKGNDQAKPEPPKPTNPSGKKLPTPKDVRPGSAKERMISKNIEIHGADKISALRKSNAAFQATKDKNSGYTMDDFVKDFPNSNAAKNRRKDNRSLHPDLNKVLGRKPKAVSKESYEPVLEDYDAYEIVLNYLLETNQANTIEEANYVMLEMDSPTIKDIVWEYVNEGNVSRHSKIKLDPPETNDGVNYPYDIKKDPKYQKGGIGYKGMNKLPLDNSDYSRGGLPLNPKDAKKKKVNEGMWTKDGKYIDARWKLKGKPQESDPSGPKVKDKPSPSGPKTGKPKPQPPKGGPKTNRPPLADPPKPRRRR